MFTGLVETTASVVALDLSDAGARLAVRAPDFATQTGDSIAVNGCCLTVAAATGDTLSFDLLGETLARTNLGDLKSGSLVNLERALLVGGRLGGHFVQGHVDCTGRIVEFAASGADYRLEVELPAEFSRYVVFKGSIAIDGISLTVADVAATRLVVWIIPHTRVVTNLSERNPGDQVNIEVDLLAKYAEKLLPTRAG